MIISIVFWVMTVLITLDSIGSKRLRAKVIHLGKHFFAEAEKATEPVAKENLPELLRTYLDFACAKKAGPIQNLRMKIKGAVQRPGRKTWNPIEAKLFLTSSPEQMLYYEDRTLAFLVSQKTFRQLDAQNKIQTKAILSIFPQAAAPVILNQMHTIAALAWRPDWLLYFPLEWSVTESGTLKANKENIEIQLEIDTDSGQVLTCTCTDQQSDCTLAYRYSDYDEEESFQVPMSFEIEEVYSGKKFNYVCQVTGLIYNEDFAWW